MEYLILIPVFLVSLTVHEFAHAWTANLLGDPTAKIRGRITLNPLKHLDPMGTIMIFLAGFGWGKPVPVNPMNLKNPKRDDLIISLAGPASNLFIAIIFSSFQIFATNMMLNTILSVIVELNIILAVFNMLPIPPLDGSSVVKYFLTPSQTAKYEEYGTIILFSILALGYFFNIPILWTIMGPIIGVIHAVFIIGST